MGQIGRHLPHADKCIFCGSASIAEEHIYSREWLRKLWNVPRSEKLGHHQTRGGDGVDESFDLWWNRKEADIVVYCVCDRCNSGWMNVLDNRTQPLLEHLSRGETGRVPSLTAKYRLAAWVTKIAFMFDWRDESPTVPKELAERFYEDRLPPRGSYIWLASTRDIPSQATGNTWRVGHGDQGVLYIFTGRVDDFVMQMIVPVAERGKVFVERRRYDRAVRSLWPMDVETINWPPDETLDEVEFVAFCDSLIRNLETGPPPL